MLTRAADIIIEVHAGPAPPAATVTRERAVWQALASVPAVRRGRVDLLYSGALVSPGPRLGQATEELARAIHPEAFK